MISQELDADKFYTRVIPPISGAAEESGEIKPARSGVQVSQGKTDDCVESKKTGHSTRYSLFYFSSSCEMSFDSTKPFFNVFVCIPVDLVLFLSHLCHLIKISFGCQLFMQGNIENPTVIFNQFCKQSWIEPPIFLCTLIQCSWHMAYSGFL